MIIKRLTIKNFGKIHNRTLELSPGINVLYGENESGKTTIHTFIKSMFYGITRQRGKAARNDAYTCLLYTSIRRRLQQQSLQRQAATRNVFSARKMKDMQEESITLQERITELSLSLIHI